MNKALLTDSAVLKIHVSDAADYSAEYDDYSLSLVRTVKRIGSTADMKGKNYVELYFFPSDSICTDKNGDAVSLPRVSYGDIAVLSVDGEEMTLRVAGADHHNGIGSAEHIKIRLN